MKVEARRLRPLNHTQGWMTGLRVGGPRSSCGGGGEGARGPICMKQQVAEISLTNHRLSRLHLWEAPSYHLSPPRPVLASPTSSNTRAGIQQTRPWLGASCSLLHRLGEDGTVSSVCFLLEAVGCHAFQGGIVIFVCPRELAGPSAGPDLAPRFDVV